MGRATVPTRAARGRPASPPGVTGLLRRRTGAVALRLSCIAMGSAGRLIATDFFFIAVGDLKMIAS